MKNKVKTREQLKKELLEKRQRINKLQTSEELHKRAEEKLKIEKAYIDQLFESAQEAIVIADKYGRVVRVNSDFIRLFGYTFEEVIGQLIDKLVAPKDAYNDAVSITRKVAKGESVSFETVRQSKDGTLISVSVLASPIVVDGELVAVAGIYRDITERKLAEEAIIKRKNQLELVHRIQNKIPMNMDIYTILKTAAESIGRMFEYNKISVNLFDKDTNEIVYLGGWNKSGTPTPRGHRQKLGDGIIGTAAKSKRTIVANDVSKEPSYVVYYQTKTKSELAIPLLVEERLIGVLDIQHIEKDVFTEEDVSVLQSIANYLAYVINEKQIEEALRKSEERFRLTFENAKDAIFWADPKTGLIIRCNKEAENLLEKERGEIIGKPQIKLHPPQKAAYYTKMFKKHIKQKGAVDDEAEVIAKSGKIKPVQISASITLVGGKPIIQGVFRDITERKKAEEKIKASLKEKEVLLREIHHRVKNNLQVIDSLLKLQSQYIKNKHYSEMFKDSQNRIKSMALIHEKLYQSKNLAKINFKEYIKSLVNGLFHSYGTHPGKIALKIEADDVYLGVNNAIPFGLIINELVSNSLKHAFPDRKEGEIKIGLRSINSKDIELVVSDNGVGIPKDMDFRKTKSLGLHLVTILAEDQLRGEIRLNRNKGTKFQIRLRGER